MVKKIYVGNLCFGAYKAAICEPFAQYGEVRSVNLITDHKTGWPRGFGFVEMDRSEAAVAIEGFNGTVFGRRTFRFNQGNDDV